MAGEGLIIPELARIDLVPAAMQLSLMSDELILMRAAIGPVAASQRWLARATQARRIAATLSAADAGIVEAYAQECEAEARHLIGRKTPQPIAA